MKFIDQVWGIHPLVDCVHGVRGQLLKYARSLPTLTDYVEVVHSTSSPDRVAQVTCNVVVVVQLEHGLVGKVVRLSIDVGKVPSTVVWIDEADPALGVEL